MGCNVVLFIILFVLIGAFANTSGHFLYSKSEYRGSNNYKNTEFPCRFPCPWRNKTFTLYAINSLMPLLNWTVDASGKSGAFSNGNVIECYQITDRFLIFRQVGTDMFVCTSVFYDGSTDPVIFSMNDGDDLVVENKMGKFTDICEVCSNPKPVNIVFVESGTPPPNGASVDCNLPSHCECCQNCTACAVCDIKANIPKACNERPRQLYQTENNNKKNMDATLRKTSENYKDVWVIWQETGIKLLK